MTTKKRIVLSLEGSAPGAGKEEHIIVWYKGTAQKDILNSIREVINQSIILQCFQLPNHTLFVFAIEFQDRPKCTVWYI